MTIQEKLWNIDLVVEDIKQSPQTYNTILKEMKNDGTCNFILRRKLNKLSKDGIILKSFIPGTRFGKVIFYHIDKKYNIIIISGRVANEVYYFFEYKKSSKFYVETKECYFLKNDEWEKQYDKTFFMGYILKWV